MNPLFNYKKIPAILVILHTMSACSSNESSTGNDAISEPEIDVDALVWSACEGSATLECTSLKVPVDYTQPELDSIDLAMARLAAPVATRKGTLLLNPGGPGASGVELMRDLTENMDVLGIPTVILDEYDIVSFDPRGVGASREVDCSDLGQDELDPYPMSEAALSVREADAVAFAAACYEKYGDYLLQLGSNNVARDMDRIRSAMGESQMNFIGYSYGSRLAATYLQLFPERVGALVMDASLPPGPQIEAISRGGMEQMQINLENLFLDCADEVTDCDADAIVSALADRVNELLSVGDDETFELLSSLLISSAQIPFFGELATESLIAYVNEGDPEILKQLAGFTESVLGDDFFDDGDSETASTAVMCADDAARPTTQDLIPLLADYNTVSDLFAEAYVTQAALCVGWPAATDPVVPLAVAVESGLLIVGGTADALTPLGWSEAIAETTGSPLIVSGHAGHTVVFQGESECVDQQVVAFLREGKKPEQTECLLP